MGEISFLSTLTPIGFLVGAGFFTYSSIVDSGSFLVGLLNMGDNFREMIASFPSPLGGLLLISTTVSCICFMLNLIFNVTPGGK